jgi:hypothetical protein
MVLLKRLYLFFKILLFKVFLILSFFSLDMLGRVKVWKSLTGIIVEYLINWSELLGDSFNNFLCHKSTNKSCHGVENSLASESKEMEEFVFV